MKNHKLLLILISFLAFISLGLPDGLLGVAWPYMHVDYYVPLDSLGLLLISFTAGYLVSSFNSGLLMAKLRLGPLLSLSCALTGASLLGYAFGEYWVLLLIAAFFLGAGGGAIDSSINSFAASNFSASVVNWLHAFFGIGATLGPVIMTFFLIREYSWYSGYITIALIQLSLSVIFLFTIKWWKTQSDTHEIPVPHAKTGETLSLKVTWLSIIIFFLYTGTEISIGQWLFTTLTKSRMIPEGQAGFWTSAYWGSLTAGRIFFGFVLARFSVNKVLMICLAGLVAGTSLIAFNVSSFTTLSGIIISGISVAPVFPSLISLTPNRVGGSHAANAVGFQISAAMIGGALLPGFAGLMTDHFGIEVINKIHIFEAVLLFIFYFIMTNLYPVADHKKIEVESV